MKFLRVAALAAATLALAGCERSAPSSSAAAAPAAPISEVEATKIADATVAAWLSMDAAKIKALYAPTIVGYDQSVGPLATDRATWDKIEDGFAAAKIDGATQKERNIQILDADTFVVSGRWDVTSSATPANNGSVRCTVVHHKDAAGAWPIVTEHCSAMPTPA